jgi:hypothetical protein
MDDDLDTELEMGRASAIELVLHLERMQAAECEWPVIGTSGEWLVTVRRVDPYSVRKPN